MFISAILYNIYIFFSFWTKDSGVIALSALLSRYFWYCPYKPQQKKLMYVVCELISLFLYEGNRKCIWIWIYTRKMWCVNIHFVNIKIMLKTANRYTIDINSLIIINFNLTLCAQLMDYFKITLQKCVQYCFVHATTQLSKI